MTYIPTYEREAYYEGKMEGIKEGKTEGIKEERQKTAREMLKDGVDFKKISSYTGLPIEEVEAIAVVVR